MQQDLTGNRRKRPVFFPRENRLIDKWQGFATIRQQAGSEIGFEVCEALRADLARAGLIIVMLTAKGRDTEVAKGLAIGADAYVTKPFSTKDLLARVKSMLGLA